MSAMFRKKNFYALLSDGSSRSDSDTFNILLKLEKGDVSYTKLNERIITDYRSFVFSKNSFVFEAFDRKIVQMFESGMTEKFVRDFSNPYPATKASSQPIVFTLAHLGIGFQVWLVFIFLSCSCFLLELMAKSFHCVVRYFVFRRVLKTVFTNKK